MTIGLHLPAGPATAGPRGCARIAVLAEELGYDSLWAPDHVVLPDPRVEPSPLDPGVPMLDPVVCLTFLAARTERILLAPAAWCCRSATRSSWPSSWPAWTC